MTIQTALDNYIQHPYDAEINFQFGYEYEKEGQTASAFSYYLRSAEKYNESIKQYESLLRSSFCFAKQGRRNFTVKGLLQQAICVCPHRPEAYFLLSRLHEKAQEWHESYMLATIGLQVVDFKNYVPLRTDVEYPGYYGLLFQKGIAAWWVGLSEESRNILSELYYKYEIADLYKDIVKQNLDKIGFSQLSMPYDNSMKEQLKLKFKNAERIKFNYSRAFQDIFVLSMLNGKEKGLYLEIGTNGPLKESNTVLLETDFKWKGITIDSDEKVMKEFFQTRNNTSFCLNLLEIDYATLMDSMLLDTTIDYLQINSNNPSISYEVLNRILQSKYRFATITFRHDFCKNPAYKELSREVLKNYGYELVVNDVAYTDTDSYEDWWVHPELVNSENIDIMKSNLDSITYAFNHMIN